MATPFLGEIRPMGFTFPPRGWALCDGQLLSVLSNQALFSLLGTMYGGDGRTTFGLPDLRGRVPLHFGDSFKQGAKGGEEQHVLTPAEVPQHVHTLQGTTANANQPIPTFLAAASGIYGAPTNLTGVGVAAPNGPSIGPPTGGGPPGHQNMMPYQVVSFCIALQGVFPTRP